MRFIMMGAGGVGGNGPTVMPIETVSRLSPGRSGIAADRGACPGAATLVDPLPV